MPKCGCKGARAVRRRRDERRRLATVLGAGAGLLLLAGGYLWLLGGTAPPQTQALGGPFELTATDGRTVTDRTFRDRTLLIYFGYTHCQDVCPTTLEALSGALNRLGPRATNLQPLFITVDPARDTPPVLGGFVAAFSPRIIGLTGRPERIRAVEHEYQIESERHRSDPTVASYDVDHSSVLFLVDPGGRRVVPIRADQDAEHMAADIARQLG